MDDTRTRRLQGLSHAPEDFRAVTHTHRLQGCYTHPQTSGMLHTPEEVGVGAGDGPCSTADCCEQQQSCSVHSSSVVEFFCTSQVRGSQSNCEEGACTRRGSQSNCEEGAYTRRGSQSNCEEGIYPPREPIALVVGRAEPSSGAPKPAPLRTEQPSFRGITVLGPL
eukprot:8155501-Pyramimonas_sp.AAC.1